MTDPIQDAAREAIDKWFSDIQLYRRDQLDSIVASAIREQVALAVAGAYAAAERVKGKAYGKEQTMPVWFQVAIRALIPTDAAKALAERERVVAQARVTLIETFGVWLAEAEIECEHKHVATFRKLEALRIAALVRK